jgi:hypothetical protein
MKAEVRRQEAEGTKAAKAYYTSFLPALNGRFISAVLY